MIKFVPFENNNFMIRLIFIVVILIEKEVEACGVIKVRHIPNGLKTWHPADDHLLGTSVYGDDTDDLNEWSVQYDNVPYNTFMFSNEYFTKWVTVTKDELIGTNYENIQKTWLRSGANPSAASLSSGE